MEEILIDSLKVGLFGTWRLTSHNYLLWEHYFSNAHCKAEK